MRAGIFDACATKVTKINAQSVPQDEASAYAHKYCACVAGTFMDQMTTDIYLCAPGKEWAER
jgi:hypothetical protein